MLTGTTFWSFPLAMILVGHFMVDVCAVIVPSSLTVIEQRWFLGDLQSAWLLGVGSLASGLAQPIFAWISDRTNNRLYGGLGLLVAGVVIGSIGWAPNAMWLFVLYMIGMMGSGMFHPIAASTIGALNPLRRGHAVTLFFIAGMIGGVTGATFAPRLLVLENGFWLLALLIPPVIVVACILHALIRGIPHRTVSNVAAMDDHGFAIPVREDWRTVALLYAAAATRFTVNLALLFLYARWMERWVALHHTGMASADVARLAAPGVGNLIAFTMAGMAAGGLTAGTLISAGREKWPLVLSPILFAPAIACFPYADAAVVNVLAFFAGAGFAAMVPVTLVVAQRLLPSRTSLASGLMLGGAWSVAMLGPVLAERLIRVASLEFAFLVTAALLALSGVILLPVKSASIGDPAAT